MGDLFYSRETGANGRKGRGGLRRSAGINDEYAAEVGARLLKEKAAPFTLVYFFEGDSMQLTTRDSRPSVATFLPRLDSYAGRLFPKLAGGTERLLEDYAVLALSDHGHDPLLARGRYVNLSRIPGWNVSFGARADFWPGVDVVAVPNGRSALLYLRDEADPRLARRVPHRRGAAWTWPPGGKTGERWSAGSPASFGSRPDPSGNGPRDPHGRPMGAPKGTPKRWASRSPGRICATGSTPTPGTALGVPRDRERCGDVVLSATPGYTFGEVSSGATTKKRPRLPARQRLQRVRPGQRVPRRRAGTAQDHGRRPDPTDPLRCRGPSEGARLT